MIDNLNVINKLISNGAIIFHSEYGKKVVAETWTVRLNKQVKKTADYKDYLNYNIATGRDGNLVDIDLDCWSARVLADYFLPPTKFEFGRASTARSHRIYKVIDLTKKHTRKYFKLDSKAKDKKMIVELRANDHYTMCLGKYDEDENVVWNTCEYPAEITWDSLYKATALLATASIFLDKIPSAGNLRDEYLKIIVNSMWQHKFEQADTEKVLHAVLKECGDTKLSDKEYNEKMGKIKSTYKKDKNAELQGLPSLKRFHNWTDEEIKDCKSAMLGVTGRDVLPAYTNEFVERIAYMMKQKKFYDLDDKELYDQEAIDMKYAKDFNGKYTPLKFWKLHPDRKVVVDFTYKPNDKNRFVKVNKKLMINIFEKNDLQPNPKADTDIFYALVKHVIPHEVERNHFLDWFAYPIQNPGKKIRYALILQSDEFQLGKGSLFDVHRDILGLGNTRKIELAEALDKGKGYLINSQTVLIDEAKSKGSWSEKSQLINTLKTLITEGSIGVRQLYKEYSEQDTCTNYWINTNYRDAFALPFNEVRYWVYFSEAKRNLQLLEEYHNQRLGGDLSAGVYADMLDRDLSKFKPLGTAPHTIYRDMMSQMADRPLNDFIKEQFQQGTFPFDRDQVTTVEMFDYLRESKKVKITRLREVATALELIGGKKKASCPVPEIGSRVTIWTIRNHKEYQYMTAEEQGRKYVPFYTDKEKYKKGGN